MKEMAAAHVVELIVVLFGLFALAGCGAPGDLGNTDSRPLPLSGQIPVIGHPAYTLLTDGPPDGPWPGAQIMGTVTIRNGCITMSNHGETALVIWHGSLRLDADMRIVDQEGRVIATDGQWIEGGGGEFPYRPNPRIGLGEVPPDCGQTTDDVWLFMP